MTEGIVYLSLFLIGTKTLGFLNRALRVADIEPPKLVCIQVFSYNEEEVIASCLESILNSYIVKKYPEKFRFQVFDSSTDNTASIAKSYGFEVIKLPRGKLRARNYSVIHYPECWIHIHLDADVYLPPNWIGNVLEHFVEDSSVVAVRSPRIQADPPIAVIPGIIVRGVMDIGNRLFGSNSVIRHDAFEKCLFNLEYDGKPDMWKEEELWIIDRLSKYGKIVFEPTPIFTRSGTSKWLFQSS